MLSYRSVILRYLARRALALLCAACGLGFANLPERNFWGEELSALPYYPLPLPAKPVLALRLGVHLLSEQRTRTVYDQFENTVGEAVVADNTSVNWLFGPVGLVFPLKDRAVVVAQVAPVRDFRYTYVREYRDDFYVKIGEDRVQLNGLIYAGAISVCFKPRDFLAAGAGLRYLWGNRNLRWQTVSGPETTGVISTTALGRPAWNAGVTVAPLERLRVGLEFNSGATFSQDDTLGIKGLPSYGALRLVYQAPGELPAVFQVTGGFHRWSAVARGLRDVFSVAVVVEHIMLNSVRLRYGFGLEPLARDPQVHRLEALFGLGFQAGRYRIDLDGTYHREQFGGAAFARPPVPEDIRVYYSGVLLKTGVEYGF